MINLEEAFKHVPRSRFLPKDFKDMANSDQPLPIGFGQTNSQPSLVYDMLNTLDLAQGQKVLDVGCGSGWTTALIGYIVGPNGKVFGTEIIPELADFAKNNCKKFAFTNLKVINTVNELGFKEESPYDRILVSAAADKIPQKLLNQLSPNNGRMVIPVKNKLLVIDNSGNIIYTQQKYGVAFVPLIT